jgi:hypothetical protein
LHSKIKTHIEHEIQPYNNPFQIKTHIGPKTEPNAILTFQTKTNIGPKTQHYNTYIPKLKHTMDMGPISIIIPICRTNNYIQN